MYFLYANTFSIPLRDNSMAESSEEYEWPPFSQPPALARSFLVCHQLTAQLGRSSGFHQDSPSFPLPQLPSTVGH